MAVEYDRTAPVLDNSEVDNIADQSGPIDQLASLDLDMTDAEITRNLNLRIENSQSYWDDPSGFDLKTSRNENVRLHLGRVDEQGLYKHQKPYKENQIFVGEEAIVSYVTAQIAGPLVVPSSDDDRSKIFASELEKAIKCHGEDVVDLEAIVEICVRNILNKRVSIIKFYFDESVGEHGEIISTALDPEHVILDKDAALGANPAFVCHVLKRSVNELCAQWPKKEKEILAKLGIERRTVKQMTKEIAVREVWVTHYVKNKPQEGVVWYFQDLVLEKDRNPNWLYASEEKNLLRYPKKPFIFGNLINYGNHLVDSTTPLEQAADQQKILNRRGRQIMENADKANGLLVISTDSGLNKDDAQNITGDPNQKLVIKTSGQDVRNLIMQIEAKSLPDYVIQDKQDSRMQVGNIMAAPSDFTGSDADDGDPTLGQVMIKKNAASGRQDMMVRAVTRMLRHYYQYLVQMMIVWYDKPHSFVHDSGDGEFSYITLKRDLIEKGIRVKASKPANPDRSRQEAIALKLVEADKLSLLDAYKILQLDNPQQLYDNWAKQQADPMALARDAIDTLDESEAYVAYLDIMTGRKVEPKENPSREYILSLRKLMIDDRFLEAKKDKQTKFIDYVNACIDSLEERTTLDQAGASGNPDLLRPGAPQLPTPLPPQTPGGAPGMGAPLGPEGLPPMGPGMMAPPAPPTPMSVFGAGPPTINPADPSQLPMI